MGMKIGELSKATGTKVETIRFYERIGLMPKPARTSGNYRDYTQDHLDRLNFVRHGRGLGFEIADIRSLLALAEQPDLHSGDVDRIASVHLQNVEVKIRRLEQLRAELTRIIERCRDGQVYDCHILEALSDHH